MFDPNAEKKRGVKLNRSRIKKTIRNIRNNIYELLWLIFAPHKLKYSLRLRFFQIFHSLSPVVTVDEGATVVLVGCWSIFTLEKWFNAIGASGKLIIVEADPLSYSILVQEIMQRKNHQEIMLHNIAAWSEKAELTFEKADRPGSNKVEETNVHYEELIGTYIEKIKVPANTLDNILSNDNVGKIDHIQLNINGAEIEALKGLEKTISLFHPSFSILSETKSDETGEPVSGMVVSFLEGKGYDVRLHEHMPQSPDRVFASPNNKNKLTV